MSDYTIDEGMEVTLHFTLKLEDGTVVDTTEDKAPATFQVGDGNLPPGFEAPLTGLTDGAVERPYSATPRTAESGLAAAVAAAQSHRSTR